MRQIRLPAAFIRGGTSKAIVFKRSDLPARELWDGIFLAAIGSPDPYGRQLDGMGGGISSLSKVCVVGPPSRPDADVDYTFAQVAVGAAAVDYGGNCGNMSSAIGPFAVDEGLVEADGPEAVVRIHNTNTAKIIEARFRLDEGRAAVDGEAVIPGVAGTGSPVDLHFLDPGGTRTGRLLPSGEPLDRLDVPALDGSVEASLVDAANPFVFADAAALGIAGNELPAELDADRILMGRLEAIRAAAGVRMGLAASAEEITARFPGVPKIGLVAPPQDAVTLAGDAVDGAEIDLTARMVSMGNVHRALPLTGVLGLAVAARIEGTLVQRRLRGGAAAGEAGAVLRIAQPSGVVEATAEVVREGAAWRARRASVRRTQRRLFDGFVYVSAARVGNV